MCASTRNSRSRSFILVDDGFALSFEHFRMDYKGTLNCNVHYLQISIEFDEILSIEKKKTALVFDNAIQVTTLHAKVN